MMSRQPTQKPTNARAPRAARRVPRAACQPVLPGTPWLRRADQCSVALLVALGLFGTVAWWCSHGGPRGELVEFERAGPRQARFLVDVNRADWPELAQLPGIGPTLAQRIIASRNREGPFLDHDDLRRVRGIGPRTVERLRPYLQPMADEESLAGR